MPEVPVAKEAVKSPATSETQSHDAAKEARNAAKEADRQTARDILTSGQLPDNADALKELVNKAPTMLAGHPEFLKLPQAIQEQTIQNLVEEAPVVVLSLQSRLGSEGKKASQEALNNLALVNPNEAKRWEQALNMKISVSI